MFKWIAGAGLGLVSVIATAGEPLWQSNLDDSPGFGLYLHKSFGGHRDHGSSFAFGFHVHPDASGLFTDVSGAQQPWRTLPLVDLRFTGAGDGSLRLYGVHAFGSIGDSGDSSDLGTEDSWTNPWFWLAVTLGVITIDCVAGWEPCDSGGNGGNNHTTTPGDTTH